MATCGACGAENRPGRRFCSSCGSPLSATCPRCGSAVEPGERFCGECGAPLAGATPATADPRAATGIQDERAGPRPAPPGAPIAERRLVTVLFADLVGFTPYAADRDPEEVRETLSRYFDLAHDVIERYAGVVEKFIGDAVMAVWGAPTAREDDAERAVRAALELLAAVEGLGPGIRARAGVLTGEAAVTLGAAGQGMVAGDLVNTASRLQSVASPGAALVGESTMRAASGAIVFEPAGPQSLKGKETPVPAWRALRVVAERGGRNRREALEAPFVGRAEEMRLLKELFHATSRERRGRLVSIVGPAGIGKSRLAWEFLKYVDGLAETVWWHDGRSPAYGDGITFWALGEMVRERCGLLETDDVATTRAKVASTLVEHVPDPDERRWIEPALLALLGAGSGAISEQLFGAWRTFFERLAATAPVVMAFEDFHFADAGLIDFVDQLLEWSRSVPIFVVTLSRPELLDRRPDWGAGKRNFHSIYLDPLPEAAMRQLLAGLVPGLPEPAVRAIVARADGVPLYAVETVRMLVGEGRLVADGDSYRPVGDLRSLAVPETLTALIASRLDALDPADRALVHDAAVLGASFTLPGLAAVSGVPEADLEPRLRALIRRELLTLEADPRSPERGRYAFVQALIREVAYNTLARSDRKRRHLAAARHFESLGSDELAGALAGHYLAAYQNAQEGAEAQALAAQARVALRAAAERAASLGSHDQALAFLEQALGVTSDPGDVADLLERAGNEGAAGGRHERAQALFRRALDIQRERGDRIGAARVTTALARMLSALGRPHAALALLEPEAAILGDMSEDPVVVALHAQIARAFMFADDDRRVLEVVDPVLEMAEHGPMLEIIADALITKGCALGDLGRSYEALGVIGAGIALAEERDLTGLLVRGLLNRANYQLDPGGSAADARRALALARRLGWRRQAVLAFGNSWDVAARRGEWEWVERELDEFAADELDPVDRRYVLSIRAQLRALRGEPTEREFDEIEHLLGAEDVMPVEVLDARGVAAFGRGDTQTMREAYLALAENTLNASYALAHAARAAIWDRDSEGARSSLAALDATGSHRRAVDASRSVIRAGIAGLEGRRDESLELYREALGAWRELRFVFDEALAAIDMVTVLDPALPEVVAAVETAREILDRLGARALLDRLDEALAASAARSGDGSLGARRDAGVLRPVTPSDPSAA